MKSLKGTKIYSILSGKCPVCQNESMYLESNPYKLGSTLKMIERCSSCNTKYKIEPSFFYGAMYVSYPVGIAFGAFALVISYYLFHLDLVASYVVIVIVMIISLPIILRISRNIWINMFMKYKDSKTFKRS
ncbi:DUF983 domain-containing protein [uncultured Maribacter sp.]|uniref:DUF983 domain-containing protein n=1 Tax=uncultured Maribacter sp. TaxID=431308 RepID=UPI00263327BB|nr:DUF983 domain-containing protein [uncultured Maribacter sp.]